MKKLLFIMFIMFFIFVFCGCDKLSMPRTDELTPNCSVFLKCMYLNQNNHDKTICDSLADGCKQANDFITCRDSKVEMNDCLLLLKR